VNGVTVNTINPENGLDCLNVPESKITVMRYDMLIRNTFKSNVDAEIQYDASREILTSPDNQYHLTLAPVQSLNINTVLRSMNTLMFYLNQHQFGKRFKNKNQYVRGIAVLESAENHNPHIHMIIRDPFGDLEQRYTLEESLNFVIPKLKCRAPSSCGRSSSTASFIGHESWCLQKYYPDRLETYLSKMFEANGYWHNSPLDNIAMLGPDGLLFGYREEVRPDIRLRQYTAR